MTIRLQSKRLTERRNYVHDWTPFLGDDTIASEVHAAVGVTVNGVTVSADGRSVEFDVSAGSEGTARITQTITSVGGRIETETFILPIHAADEPVSLETAKIHLRVFDDSEDDLIEIYIRAAREWVENHTNHVLFQREIIEQYQTFGSYLTIFRRPVLEITTIEYDSVDDDQEAFTTFEFSLGQYPLLIYPETSWPGLRTNGYITVTYSAGYAEGEVPDSLIQAVLLMVGHFYTARSAIGAAAMDEVPLAVRSLCSAYRKPVIA